MKLTVDDFDLCYEIQRYYYWNITKLPFSSYDLYMDGGFVNSFSNIDDAIKWVNDVEEEAP